MAHRINTEADGSTRVVSDAATEARRTAATAAFTRRMHAAWHAARNLKCADLTCSHAWYPA